MITSRENNVLAVEVASSAIYKFQKNGIIRKMDAEGRYRVVGTERHGYNVISYKGKKLVTARVLAAKSLLRYGYKAKDAVDLLSQVLVVRKNGISTDDALRNLRTARPGRVPRSEARPLSRKQITCMVALFCEGYSIAKIARRFRRKVSRSHISAVIRKELGVVDV